MTKPIMKPTRSMPKIEQDGDSMDEGEGQEEWLSDGGYTDDDTITSQDQDVTSSQDEQSTMQETTMPELQQVEETVENINNQLQLEINIGEDGVAIIRRQAVRVAEIKEPTTSPEKVSPIKEPIDTKPLIATSVSAAAQPAASTTSASEGTADDEVHSADDPEKLLDQLETFLIRKTDGKVLETKATVQTTLNDLVKNTVDEDDGDPADDKGGDEEVDDGNDTDELLSVLDDSVSRRTRRSLAKLQQADTTSTAKGKTNAQASKQVTKPGSSHRRTATRSSSVTNRNPSQDDKPVILSNKVVHLSNKSSSNKKSNSNQKSSQNKDKITSKASKHQQPKADEEIIKYYSSKNSENSQKSAKSMVKVERDETKKPVMAISNINFGDTYNTFIKKQSIANKKFDSILKKSTPNKVDSPKVYKRKASTLKDDKADKIDPFDKLLENDDDNENFGQSSKIKRLSVHSATKSPMTRQTHVVSSPKLSKSNFEANNSPKVSKSLEGSNRILSLLERNTSLSIKSTSPGNSNRIQTITRKAVTELPKSQSPNVQPKSETIKILTAKTQSPVFRTVANDSTKRNVSTKIRPISPLEKPTNRQNIINRNVAMKGASTINSYPNNSKTFDRNSQNNTKSRPMSEDDRMDSDMDNHDMPEWPGSDDDEDAEKPSEPSEKPQRIQEGILKKAVPFKGQFEDQEMDDGSTEFDSDEMDDSDFEDMSGSESDSLYGDMFTIDLREERAAEYLPLLGEKANEILEKEKRSLIQKLTTIRHGLQSLQDNTKKYQTEVEMSKLKIMELNTLLRQP